MLSKEIEQKVVNKLRSKTYETFLNFPRHIMVVHTRKPGAPSQKYKTLVRALKILGLIIHLVQLLDLAWSYARDFPDNVVFLVVYYFVG